MTPQPRVAFLGPDGTFSAEAVHEALPDSRPEPLPSVSDVFAAVRDDTADAGVVPIENMIEGSVNATLDELCFGPAGAYVRAEIRLPVTLHLLAPAGSQLSRLRTVRSHPVALGQCRQWLRAHVPGAAEEAETSTAEAARLVSLTGPADGEAAIAPRLSAARFGLETLAADVHDMPGNATRFVILGSTMAAATGADKTSLVVFFGDDRPGLLLQVLEEFALRGINLTKIESRPTKTSLGEYCILIDAEGHPTEARMAEALRSVHRHVAELRVFGAYPRADGVAPQVSPSDTDAAYTEALSWHRRVLDDVDPPG